MDHGPWTRNTSPDTQGAVSISGAQYTVRLLVLGMDGSHDEIDSLYADVICRTANIIHIYISIV